MRKSVRIDSTGSVFMKKLECGSARGFAKTANISKGGMRLTTDMNLAQDNGVELFLTLKGEPVMAWGLVVRKDTTTEGMTDAAIEFTHLSSRCRELVDQLTAA